MQHLVKSPVSSSISVQQGVSAGVGRGNRLPAFDLPLVTGFQKAVLRVSFKTAFVVLQWPPSTAGAGVWLTF